MALSYETLEQIESNLTPEEREHIGQESHSFLILVDAVFISI